jgi:glycosyltransferase involved in cell wall biosynthesis
MRRRRHLPMIRKVTIPFTLEISGTSARLQRLAEDRARAAGLTGCSTGAGNVRVRTDEGAVLEPEALRRAVAAAVAARRVVTFAATEPDGSIRGGAATVEPPDVGDRTHVASDEIVGAWLPGLDVPSEPSGPAVNLFTVAFGATGYAAVGRGLALGLRRAGIDARLAYEWAEIGDPGLRAPEHDELRSLVGEPVADAASVMIQPPVTLTGRTLFADFRTLRTTGPAALYTMFECDGVPARWVAASADFERLWVPSAFNFHSFRDAGVDAESIDIVPIGIDAPRYASGHPNLVLPNRRRFAFLSVFDWNERKGPDVLLRAWAAAFGPDDDVVLYLRTGTSTVGAEGGPEELARQLGLDPARMAPIEILGDDLPADRYEALFRSVDAFVLTSRGEAFCIPLLEAMAAGVPTIGTSAGGSTDFLDETTGFPIPARSVAVAPSLARRVRFYADQRWADPSVEATAAAMRRVVDDPAEAARRAAAGFVRAQLGFDRRATALVARDALARLPQRRTTRSGAGAAVVVAPVRERSSAGDAGRNLTHALAREGVVIRVEDTGAREAADDADAARRMREAERIDAEPTDVRIAVDAFPPDANVVYLTRDPQVGGLRPGVEIWTGDAALRAALIGRGVPSARCRLVPVPPDVDRWTPDIGVPSTDPAPLIVVGGEPGWIAAARSVVTLFDASMPIRIMVRAGNGTPNNPAVVSEEFRKILQGADLRINRVSLLQDDVTIATRASALAGAELVIAADPEAAVHDAARLCGVPVVDMRDAAAILLIARDGAERWSRARAQRRAALAHAASLRRGLREAFDAVSPSGGRISRAVTPERIALRIDAGLPDREAIAAELRRHASHTIVEAESEARYVAEVDAPLQATTAWDETLINALESGTAPKVRAQRYDELAASEGMDLPTYDVLVSGAFLLTRDGGHLEPAAGTGLRLRRAGEPVRAPAAWVVYGCLVEVTGSLVAIR